MAATFDLQELEAKVRDMYRSVVENQQGELHFEMVRPLAERLGSAAADLFYVAATEAIAPLVITAGRIEVLPGPVDRLSRINPGA